MKRILFIGHNASRSGGPIVLLHLLRWLRENAGDIEIDLLLLRGGDLEDDLRQAAEVYVLPDARSSSLVDKISSRLEKIVFRSGPWAPYRKTYDVVVGNTVVTLEQLKHFKARGMRTIAWLHELDYAIQVLVGTDKFVELASFANDFIVGSNAVRTMLERFGISSIHVVYDFWKPDEVVPNNDNTVREELGIASDAFVVLGCGAMEWRKGVDLFLQIAARVSSKLADAFFIWVGGDGERSNLEYVQAQHDLELLNLQGKVFLVGNQQNTHRYFDAMDVFALTSREDPFPLVCLEAASLGKPVICFDSAGGVPEFVEKDAGIVVPYGDTAAFSNALILYHDNAAERERAGKIAREKFDLRFSAERSCRAFFEILNRS